MKFKISAFLLVWFINYNIKSQSLVVEHNNVPFALAHWNETNSSSIILNNRIYSTFTGWQTGFSAFNIKKTDLNGNILFWKGEATINTASPSKLIASNNQLYYICKNQLAVFDTNLTVKFISTYTTTLPNNYWYFNDGIIASNGDLVIAGASANYNGTNYTNIKTLVVRINATNGNIIYSKTYDNTTQNIANCIVENATNNSLFISGRVINNGYTTFLLNITGDNFGTLSSSKYFTPANSNSTNVDVRKMIILNNNLYLFGRDSASNLMVTKTNVNLTNTFQTSYFTNFIYQDAIKSSNNNSFYLTGYGSRTYTSVPLSTLQLDTNLSAIKSVIHPNIINKYDSLSTFSIDYYTGLNGAYSNFGSSIFEKNGYIYSLSNKSNINSVGGIANTNHYFVKTETTFTGSCQNNFNLITANYVYIIAPTSFITNSVTANTYSQSPIIANIIPTVAITCGSLTSAGIANINISNLPKVYASNKLIYLQNIESNNAIFEMYNITGQKIITAALVYNQKYIDASKLPLGIYVYKLYYNNNVYSKKLLLE